MDISYCCWSLYVRLLCTFSCLPLSVVGKRKLGVHSAFDLVLAIMMADLASEAIFGNVTLFHALFAMTIMGALQFAGYYFGARNARLQRLMSAEPTVLVRDGEILFPGVEEGAYAGSRSLVAVAPARD